MRIRHAMLRRLVFSAAALGLAGAGLVASGSAEAQSPAEAVSQRQEAMKAIGGASRTLNQMAREQRPFDAAEAKAAFETMAANGEKARGLFPDGSDTGDSEVLPAAFENRADFERRFDEFVTNARAGAEATAQGADATIAAFRTAGQSCGGCHELYRAD